jgi:FMN reductase
VTAPTPGPTSTGGGTYTVAVVTAGLAQPSSTRLLADRLAAAVTDRFRAVGQDALVEVVELRPLAHALADNLVTGFPSGDLEAAISTVANADALVAVTPIFTASYSGLFKTFFDVLDKDVLVGKPTIIAATAGTARHSLALEHALRPLFSYLRAVVVPTAVFAATEDFGTAPGDEAAGSLHDRIDRAAGELVALLVPAHGPKPTRVTPADPFEDVTPFEQLLRGDS